MSLSLRCTNLAAFAAAAIGVSAAFFGAEREAHASGYLTARFGSDHGTPASPNAYAVYYNPAAMGGTDPTTSITLDVTPVLRLASYTRSNDALGNATLADPTNMADNAVRYRAANTGKATLKNVLGLGYFGVTSDLGLKSGLRVGYAVYVPFGGIATWDKRKDAIASDPQAPGAQDGVQRFHNINGMILALYNTVAVSYTIEQARLSFGANFSVVSHDVDTVRARNIPDNGDDIQGFDGRLNEGRTRLTAHGVNVGAAFGVYWEPLQNRTVKLGLSYTSQPGFGSMRLNGELTAQAGANPNTAQPTAVQLLQTYPDLVRLGGAWRVSDALELRADFEYVRWSVFDKQCVVAPGAACDTKADGSGDALKIILNIPRNFKDSMGARAGVGVFVSRSSEVFGSVGMTTSAVPKSSIDASTIDSNRLYLSAGARHEFSKHFALASSANFIHFFAVDTRGTARTDLLENPSRSPSANGKYTAEIFMLDVNATYSF